MRIRDAIYRTTGGCLYENHLAVSKNSDDCIFWVRYHRQLTSGPLQRYYTLNKHNANNIFVPRARIETYSFSTLYGFLLVSEYSQNSRKGFNPRTKAPPDALSSLKLYLSQGRGSNSRPAVYDTAALPTELPWLILNLSR